MLPATVASQLKFEKNIQVPCVIIFQNNSNIYAQQIVKNKFLVVL